MILANAQVLTKKNMGSPIELEAITNNIEFNRTLKVDETLFSPEAESILHFSQDKKWLDTLAALINRHSLERIKALQKWFAEIDNSSKVVEAYKFILENIQSIQDNPSFAMLQLGWGTGWDDKTYWTHLQKYRVF